MKKVGKPWWKWVSSKELENVKSQLRETKKNQVESVKSAKIGQTLKVNELKSPVHKFSIPHINVITATPFGSLKAQKGTHLDANSDSSENVSKCDNHDELKNENSTSGADKEEVDVFDVKYEEAEIVRNSENPPHKKEESSPKRRLSDIYPEYEPIRRLSADVRDADKAKSQIEVESQDVDHERVNSDGQSPQMTIVEQEKPVASLSVLTEDASRRFSKLAPAPTDSPHAKKVGTFSVIPTEKKKSVHDTSGELLQTDMPIVCEPNVIVSETINQTGLVLQPRPKPVASLSPLTDEASRKFSQLAPAPTDSPHAKQMGAFSVIPTENKKGIIFGSEMNEDKGQDDPL